MQHDGSCTDDVKEGLLNPQLVAEALSEEMQYVRRHHLFTKVDRQECWTQKKKNTGAVPLTTGWLDTDKGGGNYLSR